MAEIINTKIGDGNTHSGNIIGSFNKTVYKSDEDGQIMRWVSPLQPNNRHQGVRTNRFDGVGDWLLETGEFHEWRGGTGGADRAVLFCSGNPGVGKTYLSSLVIDSLCDRPEKENVVVAGLYCDFLAQQEQTVTNVMGAILGQLAGRGGIPNYLREAFRKAKEELGGRGLRLPDIMGMLKMAIAGLPQVFICIDALDEFLPMHLPELLNSLRDIVQKCPQTRIFLTGRPHIKDDIQRYFNKAVVIPINPNTDDIKSYVEMRLKGDTDPEAMNDSLRADIIRAILERISDIFLLVSLNMDAILGELTIRARRKKLEEMTRGNGLNDAYTATLTRLKAQKGNKPTFGLKVLMWVLYSERPLQANEICHALGVEVGSTDLDVENVPALRTLMASCLGLVTVEASSSTVRLVHCTLQEYLSSDPTLFHSPHSTIAEVCLTYLNFKCVRDLSSTLRSAPATMPLLEYASCYWGEHTRRGMTENVKAFALRLLDRFDKHISAKLTLLHENKDYDIFIYFFREQEPAGFTGLHAVAYLGIVEMVSYVLEMGEWELNATDMLGMTAITWAAKRGHEAVVKVLLERGDVNPDQPDSIYGRTPLWWAAQGGHEGVVKALLERGDVNPDQPDSIYGRTPLWWAARGGHEGVVKMLLERGGVNPDQPDTKYGRTPLALAAKGGHEEVFKVLLERGDVNPDQPDIKYDRTPLSWAAEEGCEGVVKMLLERADVNPDKPDTKYGLTPLAWAAMGGNEGVVRVLLQRRDVNPDQPDTQYGRTPLAWAAKGGHEGLVEILLERADVNPDRPDTKYGRTPLAWAAMGGHEGVFKMLLERGDVNPDRPDTEYGQTPLAWAAAGGHEGVVKMLLERGDVNPDQPDTEYGQTPLAWATAGGHEGVVKMLLERGDVNPDQPDTKYGRTPLAWAAIDGHEGLVKILLERMDVNPDHLDTKYGRTPLSWAADGGHEGVVKMLLERKDVSTATLDNENQTPQSRALCNGHDRVVTMILECDRVNSPTGGRACRDSPPASSGHAECPVALRLMCGDIDTPITDFSGQHSPLSPEPHDREPVSDPKDTLSISADSDLRSTEKSRFSEPPHVLPLLRKANPHPNNTRSTLPLPVDRYFIMASFICLLVFLVYILLRYLK